jgi:hypothetical protein
MDRHGEVESRRDVDQAFDALKVRDNWKHRSVGMKCSTCMWYCPKRAHSENPAIGRCRKHAPTLGGFPVMYAGDWCGDHKLDEEKVNG